jgi:desulfoferrodoxin-like iron-binding protein
MKLYQSYKCNKCGNIVEVQNVGGGTLTCCGDSMEMITEDLTLVNLMKAFAGESMARNKYEFFAKVAQNENLAVVSSHFQKSADNEKMHAKLLLKAYNKIVYGKEFGNTLENLAIAIGGEHYENTTMYPDFASIAKEEGHNDISTMLTLIGKVEVEHERDYRAIEEAITKDKLFKGDSEDEWTCQVCGHIHKGKNAPAKCPVCKHSQDNFKSRTSFMK